MPTVRRADARQERSRRPVEQFHNVRWDCRVVTRSQPSRMFTMVFTEWFAIVAFYRLNRAGYLALGRLWLALRVITSPLNPIIRIFVPSEIDYRADIGAGMRILHPQLGVVVSASTVAGTGLILAGGNAIGGSAPILGNHCQLGINAVIIGPVTLGDHVTVGAGAVVVDGFSGPGTLVGVPARSTS